MLFRKYAFLISGTKGETNSTLATILTVLLFFYLFWSELNGRNSLTMIKLFITEHTIKPELICKLKKN